jgi:hypothetical protein
MKKKILSVALSVLFTAAAFAQTATPAINQTQRNQHKRIQQGAKSGELTKPEERRLNAREAKIQHDKNVAKADGVVTPAEKAKIKTEQRRTSKAIAHQKHDAQHK